MKLLVTGSSGRVGRNILLDGLAEHHEVTGFDWMPSTAASNRESATSKVLFWTERISLMLWPAPTRSFI